MYKKNPEPLYYFTIFQTNVHSRLLTVFCNPFTIIILPTTQNSLENLLHIQTRNTSCTFGDFRPNILRHNKDVTK